MKKIGRNHRTAIPRVNTSKGWGKKLRDALWLWVHPAAPDHVGMFAGSLLEYDSWGDHKAPH
ncbi:hypothetical protein [Rhodoferax sp.]|uniref:hypothetical protein n=1 Tax=Rhodoferax sp. TaxID=50421 RepID=UPI00283ADD24|nr:hypothetical protein [Rhodoferax sp.]MDR3372065.1 hypothetical protein [Rhodoferax sp.]